MGHYIMNNLIKAKIVIVNKKQNGEQTSEVIFFAAFPFIFPK